jgi:hypothetical protein
MLHLITPRGDLILRCDDYYIRELASGLDELIFEINVWDPIYPELVEEAKIRDRNQQTYIIKQIDGGDTRAKIIARLDLDDWQADLHLAYHSEDATVAETIRGIAPDGWTVVDQSGSWILRNIYGNLTALEICQECCDTYAVWCRWDNAARTCTIYSKAPGEPAGSFACRDRNLKQINYKGKSNDIKTRLYAYGQDGLTFADINGGVPYVENFTYTDKILPAYWKDESYTDPALLLADAEAKLAQMAIPQRSYDCAIVDLQATDPEKYGWLDFSLFTVATLVDDIKNFSVNYQVVERHVFPYYPEKNEVIFDTSPERITAEVANTKRVLEEKVSTAQMQTEVDRATGVLQTGRSGFVVIGRNEDGYANEIYVLDRPSLDEAVKVLRINNAGIGFSSSGVAGPYAQAWTLDAHLSLGGINNAFGVLELLNANGDIVGTFSAANGLEFTRGQHIGFKADGTSVYIGDFYLADEYGRQILQSTDLRTGMSGEPDQAGQLYLWAGWESDSQCTFLVNNQGEVRIQGTLYYNGETLDDLIDGVYERGYNDGEREGYSAGYADGYADGQAAGPTPTP